MHVVKGGTTADKRGARGGWFTCILDLLLMFLLGGLYISVFATGRIDLNCRLVTSELGVWGRGRGLLRLGRVREVSGIH